MNLKSITDKDLIVYLVALGIEIKKVKKGDKKSIVYFNDTIQLREEILRYANKSGVLKLSEIIAAQRRIKTLLTI